MKRLRSILLTLVGLLVVVPLVLMMWPEGPLDLSKDEEPFRSMVLPPKEVFASGYMDGGSVGFFLIDKTGMKVEITFPIDYDGLVNAHPTAYQGNPNKGKMVRLKDPARAKAIVIRLLKEYGKPYISPNSESDATADAIRDLSEPLVRVPSRFWKIAGRWFNEAAQDL